jgi:hypothetical protein
MVVMRSGSAQGIFLRYLLCIKRVSRSYNLGYLATPCSFKSMENAWT